MLERKFWFSSVHGVLGRCFKNAGHDSSVVWILDSDDDLLGHRLLDGRPASSQVCVEFLGFLDLPAFIMGLVFFTKVRAKVTDVLATKPASFNVTFENSLVDLGLHVPFERCDSLFDL